MTANPPGGTGIFDNIEIVYGALHKSGVMSTDLHGKREAKEAIL